MPPRQNNARIIVECLALEACASVCLAETLKIRIPRCIQVAAQWRSKHWNSHLVSALFSLYLDSCFANLLPDLRVPNFFLGSLDAPN